MIDTSIGVGNTKFRNQSKHQGDEDVEMHNRQSYAVEANGMRIEAYDQAFEDFGLTFRKYSYTVLPIPQKRKNKPNPAYSV